MKSGRPALLVVNHGSRRGRGQAEAALQALGRAGLECLDAGKVEPDQLSRTIEAHRDKVSAVILGGGDGTVNAAAPALVSTGLPLGLLPLGTANDLARTLGVPAELGPAVAVIRAGHLRRIDVGRVNDRLFFNVAGIGLNVALTEQLSPETKRRWGALSYGWTLARLVSSARAFTAEIIHEDESGTHSVRSRTVQISVGNGRFYGGGFAVAEHARIDDGLLDIYSLEARSWWQMLAIAPWLRSGRHGAWSHVRTLRARRITVKTHRPHRINTDGEITTRTDAVFDTLSGAVQVFAPPDEGS